MQAIETVGKKKCMYGSRNMAQCLTMLPGFAKDISPVPTNNMVAHK